MTETVIVSAFSLIGTFCGVLTANKLSNYRIHQLEKKVDKHNSLIERMYKCEGAILELQHDITELKNDKAK